MSTTSESETVDLFTPVFKYFRRLPEADCFTEAYSIKTHPTLFQQCPLGNIIDFDSSIGLRPISTWLLYECKFCDGLYFLSNPFTLDGQRQWIDRCINTYARQDKTSVGNNNNNENLSRIRWATLGYHYDWTNKIYDETNHTKMPDELAQLCQIIMKIISSNTSMNYVGGEKKI